MPRCSRRYAWIPALLLAGVAASLSMSPIPCRADDVLWSHLNPVGSPAATTGSWVVFDSRRGRFLHGPGSFSSAGRYCFGPIYLDSTYEVSPDGFRWNAILSADSLPRRSEASAVYDSLGDRVIVFGGISGGYGCIDGSGYIEPTIHHNDAWVLAANGSAPWTELAVAGPRPSPRRDGSMVLDTKRNRLLVFGGRDSEYVALDELWELSLDGVPTWRRIATSGGPSKRSGHAAIYDPRRDRMLITCGVDSSGQYLGDAWAYDPASESWTLLAPGGPSPDGPSAGCYDRAGDQMVLVSSGYPIRLRTLDLASGSAWDTLTIVGMNGEAWNPNADNKRIAVAMSDTRAMIMLWIGSSAFGKSFIDAPIARFQPVQKLAMTFTDPIPIYTIPNPSLLWHAQMTRPPYNPVLFRNTTTGFEVSAYPDSTGSFLIYHPPMTPGTRYAFRARWFDGYAQRDTGDFFIDVPPYPTDIGFAFGPSSVQGHDAVVHFGANGDSTRISTQLLERRFPPADWQTVWTGHMSGLETYVETSVPAGAAVEFRGTWGDPAAPIHSPLLRMQMPPDPVFTSIAWANGGVDLRYTIEPGYPFVGNAYRYGVPEPDPVLVGPATAAPDGNIHVRDMTVPQSASPENYLYYLEWNVGGVALQDPDRLVVIPASAPAAILSLTNPARDQIAFTVEVRDTGPCRAEVYDVNGRRIWQETFGGGAHPVALRGSAGLYFVRLVHPRMTESKRVVLIQ